MNLKKGTLTFEILRKMQIFYFPEATFWQFSEKYKKILSRFPVRPRLLQFGKYLQKTRLRAKLKPSRLSKT